MLATGLASCTADRPGQLGREAREAGNGLRHPDSLRASTVRVHQRRSRRHPIETVRVAAGAGQVGAAEQEEAERGQGRAVGEPAVARSWRAVPPRSRTPSACRPRWPRGRWARRSGRWPARRRTAGSSGPGRDRAGPGGRPGRPGGRSPRRARRGPAPPGSRRCRGSRCPAGTPTCAGRSGGGTARPARSRRVRQEGRARSRAARRRRRRSVDPSGSSMTSSRTRVQAFR